MRNPDHLAPAVDHRLEVKQARGRHRTDLLSCHAEMDSTVTTLNAQALELILIDLHLEVMVRKTGWVGLVMERQMALAAGVAGGSLRPNPLMRIWIHLLTSLEVVHPLQDLLALLVQPLSQTEVTANQVHSAQVLQLHLMLS